MNKKEAEVIVYGLVLTAIAVMELIDIQDKKYFVKDYITTISKLHYKIAQAVTMLTEDELYVIILSLGELPVV